MPYQTERKRELFMAEKMRDGKVRCSFCHKSEDQVRKLIAGPAGSYICDECVEVCTEILEEELRKKLIANKVFVAKYWPIVDEWAGENALETWMANHILPLPIDQRYGKEDMERILNIIN